MKVVWPSDILDRRDPVDSCNHTTFFRPPFLLCSCFIYMKYPLVYMYLLACKFPSDSLSSYSTPPTTFPFLLQRSSDALTSLWFLLFSVISYHVPYYPPRSSKSLKCLLLVLFPCYSELNLRSTQVGQMLSLKAQPSMLPWDISCKGC